MSRLEEFKRDVLSMPPDEVVIKYYFDTPPLHVTASQLIIIERTIRLFYSLSADDTIVVHISGSAQLGFSPYEKVRTGMDSMPIFRTFSDKSDVDVSVISDAIYRKIMREISGYSHSMIPFPWRSGRFGDYLCCGWVRPDHFPKGVRLSTCDKWWECFNYLSRRSTGFNRTIRGGLFASRDDLSLYLQRSIEQCYQFLTLNRSTNEGEKG